MDITKKIKTIRTKAEKELGFPLAEGFWEIIEYDVGNAPTDYDGDPEGQEEYIGDYQSVTERYVEAMLITLPFIKAKPSTGGNGELTKPKEIYRKPFERRFRMVNFIIDCWERDGRSYIPWEYVTAEWNKAYPYDRMNPAVLKVEYNRTLKEELGIVVQLLTVKKWNNNDTFKRFLARLRKRYNIDPNTLKTFADYWFHLVMTKEDGPMLKFLKEIQRDSYTDLEAVELLRSLPEKQKGGTK